MMFFLSLFSFSSFLLGSSSIKVIRTVEGSGLVVVGRVLEELVAVGALCGVLEVGGLVPLDLKVGDAGGVVPVGGVHGVALEEGLVGHEVDAALVRVADDLDRGQEALDAVPGALVGLDELGALSEVVGVPLEEMESHSGL